ncbi:MAG TPA: hypothetical protein VKD90_12675, partial [Gemmataceae bacterium]|nr:hypothetical protein [Gemmataceae bacterium]
MSTTTDFGPHPAEGVKWVDLVNQLMNPGESVQAPIFGVQRMPGLLSFALGVIPYLGDTLVELLDRRKYFVLCLTQHRLLVIRLKNPLFLQRAEEWTDYPLSEVESVECQQGWPKASLLIRIRSGQTYHLRNVDKTEGPAFAGLFLPRGSSPAEDVADVIPVADEQSGGEAGREGEYAGHGVAFHYPPSWKLRSESLDESRLCWRISLDPPEGLVDVQVFPGEISGLADRFLDLLKQKPQYQGMRFEARDGTLAGHAARGFAYHSRMQGVAFGGEVQAAATANGSVVLFWQVPDEDLPKVLPGIGTIRRTLHLLADVPTREPAVLSHVGPGVKFQAPRGWTVTTKPLDRARKSWQFVARSPEGTAHVQFYPADVEVKVLNAWAKTLGRRPGCRDLVITKQSDTLGGGNARGFVFRCEEAGVRHAGQVLARVMDGCTVALFWQAPDA